MTSNINSLTTVGYLTHSLWVHGPNHTHTLASFRWPGFSDQRKLHLTENCLQIQKCCPYKERSGFCVHLCYIAEWEMVQPAPTKAFLQPAKTATMCSHPCWKSPIPHFLLVQNLYSKRGLRQLIACGQSQTMPKGVIGRRRVKVERTMQ